MPAKIQLFYNKKKKKNKLFFILTDLLYIYILTMHLQQCTINALILHL